MPWFRVAIRDVERKKMVTVLEILSPVNKQGPGRKKYLRKRQHILGSATHLVEIDLLRWGKRMPLDGKYPSGASLVVLSRANRRPRAEVWSVPLDQPLPTVPVPLLRSDPDASLNLQEILTHVYDSGRFRLMIDYRRTPMIPLSEKDSEWADQILHSKGLRS